jgi:hypothetical protein
VVQDGVPKQGVAEGGVILQLTARIIHATIWHYGFAEDCASQKGTIQIGTLQIGKAQI